jgi:hypothetical protein
MEAVSVDEGGERRAGQDGGNACSHLEGHDGWICGDIHSSIGAGLWVGGGGGGERKWHLLYRPRRMKL